MGWLHEIMPHYVEHFKRNPCSLIAKIFGVFTVQIAGLVPVKVLLMENTLQVQDSLDKLFDLKGSWVARTSHPNEFTLKDNNWRIQSQKEQLVKIDPRLKEFFKMRLRADTHFLRQHNLMDYSMLVGIEREQPRDFNAINEEIEQEAFYRQDGTMYQTESMQNILKNFAEDQL